jgi:hypothetical protein
VTPAALIPDNTPYKGTYPKAACAVDPSLGGQTVTLFHGLIPMLLLGEIEREREREREPERENLT